MQSIEELYNQVLQNIKEGDTEASALLARIEAKINLMGIVALNERAEELKRFASRRLSDAFVIESHLVNQKRDILKEKASEIQPEATKGQKRFN